MSDAEIQRLTSQLNKINVSVGGSPEQKLSAMQRIILQGIVGETGRGLSSIVNPFNFLPGR